MKIGCGFKVSIDEGGWGPCRDYSIILYENNYYMISVCRCVIDGDLIDDIEKTKIILSRGKFVREEDTINLTEAVSGFKIQLRYFLEEYKLKDKIIELPKLRVEQGIKELNGKTLHCAFDRYFELQKR